MARVILWSPPRCGSTVFQRAVHELDGVTTLYEPSELAYYYGPNSTFDGAHHRADGTVRVEPKATYESVLERIISLGKNCVEKGEHLFVKELPKFLVGRYHLYVEGGMADFQHTFIIRDPLASAWSWYRGVPPSREYENGFDRLYELYKVVKSTVDENPMVITAEDLFSRPREVLEFYCRRTGLPFSESMLSWEPKVLPEWTQSTGWEGFHKTVINSTGFQKHNPSQPIRPLEDLPMSYQEEVKKAQPCYEAMHKVRITNFSV